MDLISASIEAGKNVKGRKNVLCEAARGPSSAIAGWEAEFDSSNFYEETSAEG